MILDECDKLRRVQIKSRVTAPSVLPFVALALIKESAFRQRNELLGRTEVIRVVGFVVSAQGHDCAVVKVIIPESVETVAAAIARSQHKVLPSSDAPSM